MQRESTILIVDDNEVAKRSLCDALRDEYNILMAENGVEALQVLEKEASNIAIIILDLIMPQMDGISFLEHFNQSQDYKKIPVIVATSTEDEGMEKRCLELGVWDFISKPYNPVLLRFRVKNVVDKSRLIMAERDSVTGLYTKIKFYQIVKQVLKENQNLTYAFARLDIDRFKMINNFYGIREGDRVLITIANELRRVGETFDNFVYARLDNDVFACCIPFKEENIELLVKTIQIQLKKANKDYNIKISCGVYVIEDYDMDVSEMYDRAFLAAKSCKGQFIENIAYYNQSMIENMRQEQFIINDVNKALEEEQFVVYLQPKINLFTDKSFGAEALVRWIHPEKGMISPGEFIPIYERNGIIGRLDQYMWRQVCKLLRRWLDEGKDPAPISVNVSRVNLYNPHLVEILKKIVTEYRIPPHLLNLELTESAFMEDQQLIMNTMGKLHKLGFKIMMDDFGSGFSSLNILKDMELDYLKVDMKFLDTQELNGRGEKVLTSVIRMAKWLQLPAIVEGVETQQQVEFLKCIGCEFAQGFYFARPMPVEQYEAFLLHESRSEDLQGSNLNVAMINDLWNSNSNTSVLLDRITIPMAAYEYRRDRLQMLRTNVAYDKEMGRLYDLDNDKVEKVKKEERELLMDVFEKLITDDEMGQVEYEKNGIWYQLELSILGNRKETYVIMVSFINVDKYMK